MQVFLLLVGLVGLGLGAELIVRGATSLAKRFRLSEAFVGLGILSVGTNLPEISIAIDASVRNVLGDVGSSIALGSAIGSSIAQISLILGIVAMIGTLRIARRTLYLYGAGLLSSIILLFLTLVDGTLHRLEGAILVLFYVSFFGVLILNRRSADATPPAALPIPSHKPWFYLVFGFVLLLGNAELTVSTSLALAHQFQISEAVVSVVILGIGSSLPELSLSSWALLRKKAGLSLGNLMGSNILDTLLVPGLAALIGPLAVHSTTLWVDLPVLLGITLLALFYLWSSPKGLQKWHAGTLLATYGLYVLLRFGGAVVG